jgi:hypothetical protein
VIILTSVERFHSSAPSTVAGAAPAHPACGGRPVRRVHHRPGPPGRVSEHAGFVTVFALCLSASPPAGPPSPPGRPPTRGDRRLLRPMIFGALASRADDVTQPDRRPARPVARTPPHATSPRSPARRLGGGSPPSVCFIGTGGAAPTASAVLVTIDAPCTGASQLSIVQDLRAGLRTVLARPAPGHRTRPPHPATALIVQRLLE